MMAEDTGSTEGATALLELLLCFPLLLSWGSHPAVPLTCWNFLDIYG